MLAARMNLDSQQQSANATAAGQQSAGVASPGAPGQGADANRPGPHPASGHPLPSGGRGATLPREKWTIRQEMEARAAGQALQRVEAEVRSLARQQGATRAGMDELVQRARVGFRIMDGRACAVGADGKTPLQEADGGGALTGAEWVRRQAKASPELFEKPAASDGYVEPELPARNPFKRKFWNLTEQMRLRKRDPGLAARMQASA